MTDLEQGMVGDFNASEINEGELEAVEGTAEVEEIDLVTGLERGRT